MSKKCKTCRELLDYTERNGLKTYNAKYGYGVKCGCLSKFYLNTEEGQEKLKKITVKVTKPRKDLEQAKKEHKNRTGLTTLLKAVKDVCHRYIRERDKGKPCISCGTPYKHDHEAGHYYPSNQFSTLRFNEFNISGQCIACNRINEGNFENYTIHLPKRIGKEAFETLNALAEKEKRTNHKWDREELKKTRTYYNNKLKELKNGIK